MDMIEKILSHITDPATLARLSSTGKFWRCHGFTPSLLLGFFYQDITEFPPQSLEHHRGEEHCLAPSFIPMSELTQFIGSKTVRNALTLTLSTLMRDLGTKLNLYEPIVIQDGFLALRHRRTAQKALLVLAKPSQMSYVSAMFSVLTSEVFCIPSIPLVSTNLYALLVTEDASLGSWISQYFQLVAIWIRQNKFLVRSYCSKTKCWTWFKDIHELIPDLYLVRSPAAVSHGAIHFLCGNSTNWALTQIATVHVATEELSYLELRLDANRGKALLLANSADGGFLLLLMKGLRMSIWKHGHDTSSWVLSETVDLASSLPLRVVEM